MLCRASRYRYHSHLRPDRASSWHYVGRYRTPGQVLIEPDLKWITQDVHICHLLSRPVILLASDYFLKLLNMPGSLCPRVSRKILPSLNATK